MRKMSRLLYSSPTMGLPLHLPQEHSRDTHFHWLGTLDLMTILCFCGLVHPSAQRDAEHLDVKDVSLEALHAVL